MAEKTRKERVKERQKKRREKVVIFGEEVSERHQRDDGAIFGVLLLFVGVIFLLNSLGVIPWEVWEDLWRFWPLILILGGLKIILGNNPLSRLLILILSFLLLGTAVIFVLNKRTPELTKNIPKQFIEWSNYWEVIGK
jgi:hypothetical protein